MVAEHCLIIQVKEECLEMQFPEGGINGAAAFGNGTKALSACSLMNCIQSPESTSPGRLIGSWWTWWSIGRPWRWHPPAPRANDLL